jgi:CRISPR-associated protein Cas6
MYWQEEQEENTFIVPDDVVDLIFKIECMTLRNDHTWHLSQAIKELLPWFGSQPEHGLHPIHVASSASGWVRPQAPDELLYPSRRTRLKLRLPKEKIADAQTLSGQTLDIDGHKMLIGGNKVQLLSMTDTLYSHQVVALEDEEEFIRQAVTELRAQELKFNKLLCGKTHPLETPKGPMLTKTMMVGGLSFPHALTLQIKGVGSHRSMGCGLFIPCKSI